MDTEKDLQGIIEVAYHSNTTCIKVFKIVMEYQSFHDLQRCREVCTQWKSFIDPHIKTKGKMVISGNQQFGAFVKVVRSANVAATYPTTLILKSVCLFSGELGFYAEQISSLTIFESACDTDCLLENFPRLKSFFLYNCRLFSCGSCKQFYTPTARVKEAGPYRDKKYVDGSTLQHLHVHGDYFYLPSRTFFQTLLRQNPNLETLTYKRVRSTESDAFGKWFLFEVLTSTFQKLSSVNVEVTCDPHHLQNLVNSTSLTELSINIVEDMMAMFKTAISHLRNLKQINLGVVGQSLPNGIVDDLCRLCPSLQRVSVHCPCYPRFTRVSRHV